MEFEYTHLDPNPRKTLKLRDLDIGETFQFISPETCLGAFLPNGDAPIYMVTGSDTLVNLSSGRVTTSINYLGRSVRRIQCRLLYDHEP